MPGHPEKFSQPPEMPPETISVRQVEDYILAHHTEPGWENAVSDARDWGFKNVLPYFENQCEALSGRANVDLREARQLTAYLDRTTLTSARFHKDKNETVIDLEKYRDADHRLLNSQNAAHEKQEEEIAEGNREAWNEDIEGFKGGNVENVLRRMEKRTAFLNGLVSADERRVRNTTVQEQKAIQARIAANTAKRDAARQTRANLLREFFSPGSMH
jgi:hypothetical protein